MDNVEVREQIVKMTDEIDNLNSRLKEVNNDRDELKSRLENETDQLRSINNVVDLDNETIIKFAYLTMDFLKVLIVDHTKLGVDNAHCYVSCYGNIQEMLSLISPEYLKLHERIQDFYSHTLVNYDSRDRLAFVDADGKIIKLKGCIPF